MPLVASTLSFECDETSRDSMSVVGSTSNPIIYQANVTNIRASLFNGEPSSTTFVSDISNITTVRLIIRKNHPQGTILIDKTGTRDGTTTYVTWSNGTKQHFLFALSAVETNQAVPSDGTLDIYAVIEVTTADGAVVVGYFNGSINYDGITGVDNPELPGTGAQHANYVHAGPTTGSPALPTFRALVAADVVGLGLGGGGGSGTVTSVAFSAPNIFSVTGTPITISGTINLALATQLANTIWAGPSSGSAATPSFRSLVAGDIPSLSSVYQPLDTELTAVAGLTSTANKFPYFTGSGTAALADLSSAMRTFLTTSSSANLRAVLTDENGTGAVLFNAATSPQFLNALTVNHQTDNAGFSVDLANGNNDDNALTFFGFNNTGDPSFKVDGHGTLTLSDDDYGTHSVFVDLAHVTGQRTLHWADESGTIAVRRFNVKSYGAKGDGTTDDTTAIQNAVNAAIAAGGGKVYFPYTSAGYKTTSQILLPDIALTASAVTIEFEGEFNPTSTYTFGRTLGTAMSGSFIKNSVSRIINTTIDPTDTISNIFVRIKNLGFRSTDNPTYIAVDLVYANGADLDGVWVDTGKTGTQAVCTNAGAYGIRLPGLGNSTNVTLRNSLVQGYYLGVDVGELASLDQVSVAHCVIGYQFEFAYHASSAGQIGSYHCITPVSFTGSHYTNIRCLDIEHVNAALNTDNAFATTNDIDDVSHYGHGMINWHVVKAGVGVDSTFVVNGGHNLGTSEVSTANALIRRNSNTEWGITLQSYSTGNSAGTYFAVKNDAGYYGATEAMGSGNGAFPNCYFISSNMPNGMRFVTTAATPIAFYTNSDGNTNKRVVFESDGNITLGGATEKSWSGVGTVFQSNRSALAFGTVGDITLGSNVYWNGSASKYIATGPAAQILNYNGTITLRIAVSGSADGTITWTNALVANNDGTVSFSSPLAVGSGGTGLTSLGTGVATWLGTPNEANLKSAQSGLGWLDTAQTWTAAQTNSTSGAASTPAMKYSGVPFAGTGTTSFPLVYINDANATASTTLSTSGTSFGINAHSGIGNLADLMLDGVSKFKVTSGGNITTSGSITTGDNILIPSGSKYIWSSGSSIINTSDGVIRLSNGATTGFTRLNFALATNSAAAIGFDAVNGFTLQSAAGTSTWNDASTANSGTVADRYPFGLATPTLTSTGTSVTYTRAASIYIGGAPIASTNVTITSPYALYVAGGVSKFAGIVVTFGYTVATLPSTAATGAVQGARAYVTDALTPTFLGTLTGGSSTVTPVFHNGTAWVSE